MDDIISASHDIVFKALFVNNPDLLRAFLRDVLDLPLTDSDEVVILNPELIPKRADGKLSRLDIHVNTANRKFNIEMQARQRGFSPERVLYYWCEMFKNDVTSGSEYEKLEQAFSVNILGFHYLECAGYHSSYSVREDTRGEQLTDKLSIHIFELPKVPKQLISGDKKQLWMKLIQANSKEALEMVRNAAEQNSPIVRGVDAVYHLSADTVLREQIRQHEKDIRDYENDMAVARSEGRAEGEAKGRAEGRAEGEAKGKVEGMLGTLAGLVKKGILTLAQAAGEAGMTVSEFETKAGLHTSQ